MQSEAPFGEMPFSRIAVIVPVRRPGSELPSLIVALQPHGFGALVVVDDGSGPVYASVFAVIAEQPRITVLRHAVNLGKGRALKTAFNHVLAELPWVVGVVTADGDGQHTAADIAAVALAMLDGHAASTARTVLGTRTFGGGVPPRSKLGNVLTRYFFKFATGVLVSDTQTGLRGIPATRLPELMVLAGERYEYEMSVLAHLCRVVRQPLLVVPIQAIYIDGNNASHFDPIRDSMRVYFVLLRFYLSSLVAAAIDFAGFSLMFSATHNLALSVAVGRLSSLVNFALNKGYVFNNASPVMGTILRYYLLAVGVGGLSYVLIRYATGSFHWNVFATKAVVDVLLSLISFSAQQTYVFRRSERT